MDLCMRLNWKQPNHGVFLGMTIYDAKISLKDAVYIAKRNHLLGLIVDAQPLV
jgi:hypothetical protein